MFNQMPQKIIKILEKKIQIGRKLYEKKILSYL